MPTLKADFSEVKKLERDLATYKAKAMPFATRAFLNDQAFEAQTLWRKELPTKMKLRTKYTEQSIRVEKSHTLDINRQVATVGSIAEYMDEQEYGATEPKKGQHGVPIPAASPGRRNRSRGKLSKAKQFKAIKLLPRVSGHRSRQVAASLAMAAKRGSPSYAFLSLKKGRKGIYALHPGKKRSAIRKVWDLSKPSVTIPQNPTMGPAVEQVNRKTPRLWEKALLFQLRRHKILGY